MKAKAILRKFSLCLLGTSVWMASVSVGSAQTTPLELFGKDVDVLLRLHEPDQAIENVANLVDSIQPNAGSMIQNQAEQQLGRLISNPSLTGVDQTRDWYVGVYSDGTREPVVVFLIPAINAEDMQDALGEKMTTTIKDRWVMYTESEELPDTSGANASNSLSESARAAFEEGTLGVFVNASHLTEVYSDEIELGQEQVLQFLNNMRFMMPQQPGMDLGAIIDIYGTLAEGFFQGLNDSHSFTASVTIDDKGIAIDEFIEFAEDSETAEYIAKQPTSSMPAMANLPSDAIAYYGVSGAMKEMTRWGMEMSISMMGEQEQKDKLENLLTELDDVEFGAMVAAIKLGDAETGFFNIAAVVDGKPIEEIRDFVRKSASLMGEVEFEGFKQTTILEEESETIGDHKADVMLMKQEWDESLDPSGMQQKMQNMMFGPNGMQSRTVYLEDRYLTTMGGGKQPMVDLLNRINSSEKTEIPVYAHPIQEQSNLLVHVDLPRLVARMLAAAASSESIPLPLDQNMIDNLNLQPSYLGFSAGGKENTVRFQTRIPTDQIQGFAKIGVLFAALQAQRL